MLFSDLPMNTFNIQTITGRFNIKQWFLISLLLRLIVMPFTVHGDLFFVYNTPHIFSHGEWNAYQIASENFSPYYPPFALIFFSSVQIAFRFIFPGFEEFTHSLRFLSSSDLYESEHLFTFLFLMKLPYLLFDTLIILTCWKMLPNDKSKLNFTIFWAVNPVVIYSTYMFGQFDLIPSSFVILACYFSLQRGKEHYACLSIAAGCLFKIFPIVFLPIVLLISARRVKDFIRLSLYGIFPVLFFYGVFYAISGEAALKQFSVLSYNTKMFIDYKIVILRFCQGTVYLLLCAHLRLYKREQMNYTIIIQYFLAIYIAVHWGLELGFTQYLAWMNPFLVLFVQQHPKWEKKYYFLILIIFLGGLKSRTSALGVFAPINPDLFLSFPSLKDFTGFIFNQKIYDYSVGISFKIITALWVLSILKYLHEAKYKEILKNRTP